MSFSNELQLEVNQFVNMLNLKFTGTRHFEIIPGRKYFKITVSSIDQNNTFYGQSAYLFIDGDGNILKAAGWKTPAAGARGNLFTDGLQHTVDRADAFGGWLYKR